MSAPLPTASAVTEVTAPGPLPARDPRALLLALARHAAEADDRNLSLCVCAAFAADETPGKDHPARYLHLVADALRRSIPDVEDDLDPEVAELYARRYALAAECMAAYAAHAGRSR